MGGSAFPSLDIQRIPADLFPSILEHYRSLLSPRFFALCFSPLPVPEKSSHGDLDLLVALPSALATADAVSAVLKSRSATRNHTTTSYAVPCPHLSGALIQLDVHVCPSAGALEWLFFEHSHGDLWNILGLMARTYGVVLNDVGMFLRLPEFWCSGGPVPMLELTRDPSEALKFFGLDKGQYWRGWQTIDAMFDYARGCRFYEHQAVKEQRGLRTSGRQRIKKRVVFRRWVEEEAARPLKPEECKRIAKKEVVEEALRTFGKEAAMETIKREFEEFQREGREWDEMRNWLPVEGEKERALTVRALKKRWDAGERSGALEIGEFVYSTWKDVAEEATRASEAMEKEKPRLTGWRVSM